MTNSIEIQRTNVSVVEFFHYIKTRCALKGRDFNITQEEFEKPHSEYLTSYTVIGDKKKCHYAEYRTYTNRRRKYASYTTSEGFTRYYPTDEFEEYEETKLYSWDDEWPADDAPCKAETIRSFAYNLQTYVLNFDGSCYNEICEFTFDDDFRGHGYYYQLNKDAD